MTEIQVETFDAPAIWASALINGDLTSFDYYGPESLTEYEQWCTDNPELLRVVDCSEESFVGRFNGLQTELLTYTCHLRPDERESAPFWKDYPDYYLRYFAQGARCGSCEAIGRCGSYTTGETDELSWEAASNNVPETKPSELRVWAIGYKHGYKMRCEGIPLELTLSEYPLPENK